MKKTIEEPFVFNEVTQRYECELEGSCDVTIQYNSELNRYEILVGDEDCARVYVSKYEPGVFNSLPE